MHVSVTTSPDRAGNPPQVTVTSSNDDVCEATSLPHRGLDNDAHSLPKDAKNSRRMRSGYAQDGDQSACELDSPGGSTVSRCSRDHVTDDDDTVTSRCNKPLPTISPALTCEEYVLVILVVQL